MDWYYIRPGKSEQRGIVQEPDLFAMAKKKQLKPSDLVWSETTGNRWIVAAQVEGLFSPKALKGEAPAQLKKEEGEPSGQQAKRPIGIRVLQAFFLCIIALYMVYSYLTTWSEVMRPRPEPGQSPAASAGDTPLVQTNETQEAVAIVSSNEFALLRIELETTRALQQQNIPAAESALNQLKALDEDGAIFAKLSKQLTVLRLTRDLHAAVESKDLLASTSLLANLQQHDPTNSATVALAKQVELLRMHAQKLESFKAIARTGETQTNAVESLIPSYLEHLARSEMLAIIGSVLADTNSLTPKRGLVLARLSKGLDDHAKTRIALKKFAASAWTEGDPEAHAEAAAMMAAERLCEDAARLLEKFLEKAPRSASVWYELAAVKIVAGNQKDSLAALKTAVKHGGDLIRKKAAQDARFNALKADRSFVRLVKID